MTRLTRPLSVLAAAVVVAFSLACSGLQDAALDAIENNPEARAEFDKEFKENFVKSCKNNVGGKKKAKAAEVCACAADTLLAEKSLKEIMAFAQEIDSDANQKEMMRVLKKCK